MKKITKILSVVMAVVMLFCATPIAGLDMPWSIDANAGLLWGGGAGGFPPEGSWEGDFYYIVSDGEASITGYSDDASGSITIPSTIGGYPVTSITDFWGYTGEIRSVTIPKNIINIAEDAFENATLTKFVVAADNPSFSSDSKGVLFNKDKTTLIRCPSKKSGSYTIPESVTSINTYAFINCDKLTGIFVDPGNTAFSNDSEGVLFDKSKTTLICFPTGKSGSYSIPDSTKNISERAFYYCHKLISVTIPDGVKTIGDSAFYYCPNLTSITIPNSVTSIGDSAFCNCTNLTSVTLSDNITEIPDNAFIWCSGITSVTIPDGVTSIGERAFNGCSSLISIKIPDSVTVIGNGAFYYCTGLTSVSISSGAKTIGDLAFADCNSLTSVVVPKNAISLGADVFGACESLTKITVDADNPCYSSDSDGVLFNKNKTTLICYPAGKTGSYSIPYGVTTIEMDAFFNCSALTSVTIPDSVTSIGDSAFGMCNNLKEVTIGNGVLNIDSYAFKGCGNLKDVKMGNKITTIGKSAFGYSGLTSITIPDSVTKIDTRAFVNCNNLKSVIIGNGITNIERNTFAWCGNLTSVTIPNSVTHINDSAFYDCDSLTDIYYNGMENDWNSIEIGEYNYYLKDATVHFLAKISFEQDNYTVNYKGSLKVVATPNMETGKKINYVIGDSTVATIDDEGNITTVGPGTATVIATIDGTDISDTCTITVSYTWWQWIIMILLFGWIWY